MTEVEEILIKQAVMMPYSGPRSPSVSGSALRKVMGPVTPRRQEELRWFQQNPIMMGGTGQGFTYDLFQKKMTRKHGVRPAVPPLSFRVQQMVNQMMRRGSLA